MTELAREVATQIWTILVEEVGAREDDRRSFVQHQGAACTEWRFQGELGFGGKFYPSRARWYVGCYPEDRTATREALIERANRRLESLRAGLIDNRLPV